MVDAIGSEIRSCPVGEHVSSCSEVELKMYTYKQYLELVEQTNLLDGSHA